MKKFPSLQRAFYGIDTWKELALRIATRITKNRKYLDIFSDSHANRLAKKFITKDCIKIKDVKLPLLDKEHERIFWGIFEDTFASYYYFNDRYDEKTVRLCEGFLGEGLYGLVNDKVNVQVNPGDVVIDAGSWIGDFAAYSAIRGGNFCL